MKLLTLRASDGPRAGVMVGDEVLDLVAAGAILGEPLPATVRQILAGGGATARLIDRVIGAAQADRGPALRAAGALQSFAAVTLAPVVPDPAMFLSIGANSVGHLREMGDPPPPTPDSFFKVRSALAASGDTITPPPRYAGKLDWEGELCAVVGARCHAVTPEEADDYIAGYTLTNDVSARDAVPAFLAAQSRGQVMSALRMLTQLKNFPGFCPIGPVIATRDEFPAEFDYHMETLVNGEVVQSSTSADLVFSPAQILSYYSEFFVLEPGDMFSLGSPPGVGMAMKPPRFLIPGDVVEVRLPEIGVLRNTIGAS